MPYGLQPYDQGYGQLQMPRNGFGAQPLGAYSGMPTGQATDPGLSTLRAPAGALSESTAGMGGLNGSSGGSLGPLAGFAMNMFISSMNKGQHAMAPPQSMPIFNRQMPQMQPVAPPSMYHPIAIGRPYG